MTDALKGLDTVAWDGLDHAYGSAKDVPEMLRALQSKDDAAREEARANIRGSLDHQGVQRFESTLRAIPFLIQLLADATTPGRAELPALIADLAVGDTWWWLHNGFHPEEQVEPDGCSRPQAYAETSGGGIHVRAFPELGGPMDMKRGEGLREIYEAAAEAIPACLDAMQSKDEELRASAPYLLAFLTPWAKKTAAPLTQLLREDRSPLVRASAALGLSHATKFTPAARESAASALQAAWSKAEDPLERRCVALALVRFEDEAISEAVRPELHAWLEAGVPAVAPKSPWPWQRIDAPPFVFCTLFLGTDEEHRDAAIVSGARGLPTVNDRHDAADLAVWLVNLAAPNPPERAKPKAAKLPPLAREVLAALLTCNAAWYWGDVSSALEAKGLPNELAKLKRWLG